jgi:hypothetical protein
MVFHRPWLACGVIETHRQLEGSAFIQKAHREHHELVAAKAREDVSATQGSLQPSTDLDQQVVADLVAVKVVDFLETVEIAEQDADPAAVLPPGLEGGTDADVESPAVG